MNLKLPGQYFDEETGLHDNWHRTYDPRPDSPLRGRYLSPDPLGYPDGPDAYLYASGDPINRIDPTGLYQEDIHYYMTFFLALAAGVPYDAARTIALAAQYVDDNDDTRPLNISGGHQRRLLLYHFTLWTGDEANPVFDTSALIENPDARSIQLRRLLDTSRNAPNPCAQYQFFGEYLHAFEDTFGHRNNRNVPFTLNNGLGHGLNGSEPDFTYDDLADTNDPHIADRAYFNREARTLQMEREVFAKLQQNFGNGNRSFSEIESLLREFNATREDGAGAAAFEHKIRILQRALDEWDIRDADGQPVRLRSPNGEYNARISADNRARNLCHSGHRLRQEDYPGTILPRSDVPC